MAVKLTDVRSIRHALGKSQSEMARILSISTRAVQSYEQGWRALPAYVQKTAATMLFLNWRKGNGRAAPCWETRNCSAERRAECQAYLLQAGDLCWLISGTRCCDGKGESWPKKAAQCQKCPVTRPWLGA